MSPEIAIKAALQVGLTFELPANKLLEYAELIADYERRQCLQVCIDLAKEAEVAAEQYGDADSTSNQNLRTYARGHYVCAEYIKKRWEQ